jgi:hypothetical protein
MNKKPDGHDLYIIQMDKTGAFKVGRSKHIDQRLTELQVGCPHRLRVILRGEGLGHLERSVHQTLSSYQTRYGDGEWFHEEGLGSLPTHIYDLIPVEVLEDPDWWKGV